MRVRASAKNERACVSYQVLAAVKKISKHGGLCRGAKGAPLGLPGGSRLENGGSSHFQGAGAWVLRGLRRKD